MRFKLIDEAKKEFPVHRLCSVPGVSESGYFAWKERPASRRQNEDLILLAHIRSQFSTSNETYGAPRMHVELKEDGLEVGRHRVARLMRDNGLKALQKRRYKKTTDSCHSGRRSPPTCWIKTSPAKGPIRNGVSISATSGRLRAGSIWPSCLIYTPGASSAGRRAIG